MPGTPASDRLVSGEWRTSVANPWPTSKRRESPPSLVEEFIPVRKHNPEQEHKCYSASEKCEIRSCRRANPRRAWFQNLRKSQPAARNTLRCCCHSSNAVQWNSIEWH